MAQIDKPSLHFNTKTYTGNGGTQAITGVGFQPDMIWCKARGYNDDHTITDAVRGNTKVVYPNNGNAEATSSSRITAFGTDGFTLGSSGDVNSNNSTYAAWNWKAGTGQGSSNTDGSINTTYTSVNTTARFSISKYTGTGSNATFGHGLGVIPDMVIVKNLSGTDSWMVYHRGVNSNIDAEDYILQFNTNITGTNNNTVWNDTAPTSSVVSIGTDGGVNSNGSNYIAYCFASKPGYSRFGRYIGNADTNGSYVYTGFKPAFVLIKDASSVASWGMFDNKRDPDNIVEHTLFTNSNTSEDNSTDRMDILSNGFKHKSSDNFSNKLNANFIYMAFAEEPLVGSNNIPATAR